MPSTIANKAQERANYAFTEIKKVAKVPAPNASNEEKNKAKEFNEKFKSHIKDVPMMIMTNGLASAFAFVFSKQQKDETYKHIEDITKRWLIDKQQILSGEGQLHEILIRTEQQDQYRLCTREIMALYTWLKRYADGLITD